MQSTDTDRPPLPDTYECTVAVKISQALGKSRSSAGEPIAINLRRVDSFYVVSALIFDKVAETVSAHNASGNNEKLSWGQESKREIYLKCTANIPQSKYVLLNADNYLDLLTRAWENAAKLRAGQSSFSMQVFVYVGTKYYLIKR